MTTISSSIEAHWASAPAHTVLRLLKSRGMSVEDLADSTSLTDAQARGVVTGATSIDEHVARELSNALGASVPFWMAREADFRHSTYWLEIDAIAERLPMRQLVEFGWFERGASWRDRASIFLTFFDISSASEWNDTHGTRATTSHFRASDAVRKDDVVIAAWLKKAAVEARSISRPDWDLTRFEWALSEVRKMTRIPSPDRFVPMLVDCVAQSGVAVVVLRAPTGCPASGAAFLDDNGAPVIALSGRGLTDDKFWFTFFHEASHVMRDDLSRPYIEDFDKPTLTQTPEEKAADHFAADYLIPGGVERYFDATRKPKPREVMRVASELGIAPGIVVGALQHLEIIAWSALGSLKRHYHWEGSNLRT